jgi:hypothetical protein
MSQERKRGSKSPNKKSQKLRALRSEWSWICLLGFSHNRRDSYDEIQIDHQQNAMHRLRRINWTMPHSRKDSITTAEPEQKRHLYSPFSRHSIAFASSTCRLRCFSSRSLISSHFSYIKALITSLLARAWLPNNKC